MRSAMLFIRYHCYITYFSNQSLALVSGYVPLDPAGRLSVLFFMLSFYWRPCQPVWYCGHWVPVCCRVHYSAAALIPLHHAASLQASTDWLFLLFLWTFRPRAAYTTTVCASPPLPLCLSPALFTLARDRGTWCVLNSFICQCAFFVMKLADIVAVITDGIVLLFRYCLASLLPLSTSPVEPVCGFEVQLIQTLLLSDEHTF